MFTRQICQQRTSDPFSVLPQCYGLAAKPFQAVQHMVVSLLTFPTVQKQFMFQKAFDLDAGVYNCRLKSVPLDDWDADQHRLNTCGIEQFLKLQELTSVMISQSCHRLSA